MTRSLPILAMAAALLGLSTQVVAEPSFVRQFKSQYGYTPSCNACHKDGGGTPVNGYGAQYKEAGKNLPALAAIGALDGDGDGFANADEIAAKANPGSARSTPSNPGDWLDVSNLIPREVQAAFAGVTRYKPLDAILTSSEIERAAAMGVSLEASDENTIYIPVDGGRAIGMAIIVPAAFADQAFFLLVTADRQMAVTGVAPIHTGTLDAAKDRALYGEFKGLKLNALPAPAGVGLKAAVREAVRKAGAIMYVRLKKA